MPYTHTLASSGIGPTSEMHGENQTTFETSSWNKIAASVVFPISLNC